MRCESSISGTCDGESAVVMKSVDRSGNVGFFAACWNCFERYVEYKDSMTSEYSIAGPEETVLWEAQGS